MKRREFIVGLGGAAVVGPLVAHAQRGAMPVVGFLHSTSSNVEADRLSAFQRDMQTSGFVNGQNVIIEYRWAEGRYEKLATLAAELVSCRKERHSDHSNCIHRYRRPRCTRTCCKSQPSRRQCYGRKPPEFTAINEAPGTFARVGPNAGLVAALMNPSTPTAGSELSELQTAAKTLGQRLHVINANNAAEIDAAFVQFAELQPAALLTFADPFFFSRREQIIGLALKHKLPAIYPVRDFVRSGGLASYGDSIADAYHQAGVYIGKILAGAKPNDLPVIQPTKFELMINLKTARALGLTVPPTLLARADEVIE